MSKRTQCRLGMKSRQRIWRGTLMEGSCFMSLHEAYCSIPRLGAPAYRPLPPSPPSQLSHSFGFLFAVFHNHPVIHLRDALLLDVYFVHWHLYVTGFTMSYTERSGPRLPAPKKLDCIHCKLNGNMESYCQLFSIKKGVPTDCMLEQARD